MSNPKVNQKPNSQNSEHELTNRQSLEHYALV